MIRTTAFALAALMALPTVASAHGNDARMTEQAGMIERGRQDGSITWTEGLKLRQEQRQIARVYADFMSDGRLTTQERRIVHRLQNEAERNIFRAADNNRQRLSVLPRVGR